MDINRKYAESGSVRTISVASTRVPTIFNRTRVFFSMICDGVSRRLPYGQNGILVHPKRRKVGLSLDQTSYLDV
jgi:hypothetical protein